MPGFYRERPGDDLRFGDVVTGFQAAEISINNPSADPANLKIDIAVSRPPFFVVMTPCCSIEEKSVALAPLEPVRWSFFRVPYLVEDLTRINAEILPTNAISPEQLARMGDAEKQEILTKPPSFVYLDCFVYEAHPLFPEYELRRGATARTLKHRMVDFKSIFKIQCDKIQRNAEVPNGIKVAELTIATREKLRNKLVQYFARVAEEDLVEQQQA